jgi:hypothetical protein
VVPHAVPRTAPPTTCTSSHTPTVTTTPVRRPLRRRLGSLHFFNISGGLLRAVVGAPTVFVVAVGWGWAYERTGNLAVPILLHGLYNTGLVTVAYLSIVVGF